MSTTTPTTTPVSGEARYRHKKRGTEYFLLGIGKMQAEDWFEGPHSPDYVFETSVDMREVAVYQSVDDGAIWVRPREEFEDGRFEPIPTTEPDHGR